MKKQGLLVQVIMIAAILGWSGIARATAIMNVFYDRYDLNVSAVWGPNADWNPNDYPADKPLGTIESAGRSGSLLTGSSPFSDRVSAWSNNVRGVHADVEYWHSGTSFSVGTISGLDDDVPGSLTGYSGSARSRWSLLFEIYGEIASLDVGGWLLNGANITNKVYLEDVTDIQSNEYYNFTTGILLLPGHRYALTQISSQERNGIDDEAETWVYFHNVDLKVPSYYPIPEPSSLLLMESGLLGCLLLMRRRNKTS